MGGRGKLLPRKGAARQIQTFTTKEAATLLGVSATTLRGWERRFGFPASVGPQTRRQYPHAEVFALRAALHDGLAISSAISSARSAPGSNATTLVAALAAARMSLADVAMDASLALRSVEQTIEEVLLPALERIYEQQGAESMLWAYAATWAEDWLIRARRLNTRDEDRRTVLVGHALDALDPIRSAVYALAVCATRQGVNALVLPARALSHSSEIIRATGARMVIVAGPPSDATARWAYAVARTDRGISRFRYRPGFVPEATSAASVLPSSPVAAAGAIQAAITGGAADGPP